MPCCYDNLLCICSGTLDPIPWQSPFMTPPSTHIEAYRGRHKFKPAAVFQHHDWSHAHPTACRTSYISRNQLIDDVDDHCSACCCSLMHLSSRFDFLTLRRASEVERCEKSAEQCNDLLVVSHRDTDGYCTLCSRGCVQIAQVHVLRKQAGKCPSPCSDKASRHAMDLGIARPQQYATMGRSLLALHPE